jgi:IclR family transcriptional regulator, KDG regulon repressor
MPERDGRQLQSLDLALRVVEALDAAGAPRGVTELTRDVSSNKATVHRILATLAHHAYVVQDPETSRYRIGPRLQRFGRPGVSRFDLPEASRPFLVELRDLSLENIHLAVLDEGDAIYIAKEAGLHAVQVVSSVGARCPAHCVATGKALLAWANPELHDQLLGQGLAHYTPATHSSPESFRREMARIRAQGYAVNAGEWRQEVRGIAAPVFDANRTPIAAIGLCAPSERLPDHRIESLIPMVIDVAARFTSFIGGAPGAAQSN